jgi:tetratricopeptide (TPR) repeat protein
VDLFAFINPDEDRVRATRFFVEEKPPTGDEDRDFAEMLAEFKAKVAAHVGEDDSGSHYDLGLAFKEMGLIDEAIGEFQMSLRAGANRLKVFEELGQCFILKRQPTIAVKILARALQIEHDDELEMIGVYYHLGRAYEDLGKVPEARDSYERVLGLDIGFMDVMERVSRL